MVKLGMLWKLFLLPAFYVLAEIVYSAVFNAFGIEMASQDRVESFLLICAVALTALMAWCLCLMALRTIRSREEA